MNCAQKVGQKKTNFLEVLFVMLKRSLEFKLEVLNYVLKECYSIMETSKKYRVSRTSIRDWLLLYKHNGEEGLFSKERKIL